MELIKPGTNIDFVNKIKAAVIASALAILIAIASLLVQGGPNYGIDFAGGTLPGPGPVRPGHQPG